MFRIFGVMCLGAAIGWLTRRAAAPRRTAGRVITAAILLLMLFLGAEVGGNPLVLGHFGSIGVVALLLGTGSVAGVLCAANLVWRYSFRSVAPQAKTDTRNDSENGGNGSGSRFSLVIVGTFAGGIALGIWTPAARWIGEGAWALGALYLLMLAVGITLGSDAATLRSLVKQPKRTLLVPVATILGSWAGASAVWAVLRIVGAGGDSNLAEGLRWVDAMAVGSGQGYYSLSGVLLGELRGPAIGTIALLANILRELLTVVGAGWMARRFSPLGPICSAGATAVDVSLPAILRHCGPQYLAVALLQGVVADLSVPLLLPLLAQMAT